MKKIAVLMYYMNCGGVEKALIELLKRLRCDDNQVDLILLEAKGEFLKMLPSDINIIKLKLSDIEKEMVLSLNIREVVAYGFKCRKIFETLCITTKYMFWRIRKDSMAAYKAINWKKNNRFLNYNIVFDFHGYSSLTTYLAAKVIEADYKYTWIHSEIVAQKIGKFEKYYKNFDQVFAVSNKCADLSKKQIPELKVEVFYNFIDEQEIIKLSRENVSLKKKECSMILLTVGRLSWEKGFEIAIEAASKLKEQGLDFRWYFCGDGELYNKLKNDTRNRKLEDEVVFLGFQDNPYKYICNCDIYIQPSRYEGYAVTLMEAAVLKKVIITTEVSGSKEAVENGVNGYIIQSKADDEVAHSIAEKVLLLSENQEFFQSMKEKANMHSIKSGENSRILQAILKK